MYKTVGTLTGPTGKPVNCDTWADYTSEGQESALCNGGYYEGDHWAPCPSRGDCKRDTLRENSLTPLTNKYGARYGSGYTPPPPLKRPGAETRYPGVQRTGASAYTSAPTSLPTKQRPKTYDQIVDPEGLADTEYLNTPHIAQKDASPVWLPREGDSLMKTVAATVAQGSLFSLSQVVGAYARTVDLTPKSWRRRSPAIMQGVRLDEDAEFDRRMARWLKKSNE